MPSNEEPGNRVVIRLEGTFDAAEAWRVHDAIQRLEAERVVLDFREVRACHDFAIALLAKDLIERRGRVEVTGLCQHQRRILRYFGADEVDLGEPRAGGPAERAGSPLPADLGEPTGR